MIMDDDDDGKMIFGDLGGLKLPDICLRGEEKPRKTSPRKLVPAGDRTRTRCVTGAYAPACSTVVDTMLRMNFAQHIDFQTYTCLKWFYWVWTDLNMFRHVRLLNLGDQCR